MQLERGQRKVTLRTDGLEVVGIKWRVEFHQEDHVSFQQACKKDPCVYCLGPSQTWEHVTPSSLGGGDGWDNIARACQQCNERRGILPFLTFIMEEHKNNQH